MKATRVLGVSKVLLAAAQAKADVAWREQKVSASDGRANTRFGQGAAYFYMRETLFADGFDG